MSTLRITLVPALAGLLAGVLLLGAGCHTAGSHTTAARSPSAPPAAEMTAPAPEAPATPAAPAAKPSLLSRLFPPKAPAADAEPTVARKLAPVTPPVTKADTNKTYVPYRIQLNDTLLIALRGITPEQPNIELVVDENGEIRMPYINNIKAEGLTPTELENAIRDTYITQKIYKRISVNVIVPAMTQPTFYVKGEVRAPGRLPYVNGMTLLTAIAAAGGTTDFFSPNMELVRGGKKIKFNYYDLEKHPDLDQPIQSGDIIIVYKSFF